jgi:hypothetical protein
VSVIAGQCLTPHGVAVAMVRAENVIGGGDTDRVIGWYWTQIVHGVQGYLRMCVTRTQ